MPISVPGNTRSASPPLHTGRVCACVCVSEREREAVLSMPALNEMDQSVMAPLLLMFKPTWTPRHKFLVKDSMDAVKSYLLYG